MILVCGEALMDVFALEDTATGVALEARLGGSPFNVAIGLARLRQPVAFLGGLSTDNFGERLARALRDEGVDLRHAQRSAAPTTLGVVGLNASGSPSYAFHGYGAADRLLSLAAVGELGREIRALHFGSFSMVVEPVAQVFRAVIERENETRVVAYDPNVRLNVDPRLENWIDTVDWMAQHAHLIKISAEDLDLLYPGHAARELAARWQKMGVSVVVVTRGDQGALGFTANDVVEVESKPVRVVDTVGAGDSFQAALLTWLAEHARLDVDTLKTLGAADLRNALAFAASAAAITCSRRGANPPTRDELA